VKPAVLPEVEEADAPVTYERRVLFLTGTWERVGNLFRFRATIFVAKDGTADGSIYWHALRVHEKPANYFATEWVRGSVRGREVALEGYQVEEGLSADTYKIALDGDGESGPFGGITRTWLNNWSGRIGGHYVFRNRTA
jgi:hypothetical protein